MARILGDIVVKKIGNHRWELHEPIEYHVGDANSEEVISIPKGFKTDFASVPRPLWGLFPPNGKHTGAAIVHDYLYQNHIYSRKKSDKIFLEIMKIYEVSWIKRYTMYRAVRLFGRGSWLKGK